MEIVPNCQCQETSGAPHSARLPTHFLLDHSARRLALALVLSCKTRLTRFQRRAPPTWPRYVGRRLRYPRPQCQLFCPRNIIAYNKHKRHQPLAIIVSRSFSRVEERQHPHSVLSEAAKLFRPFRPAPELPRARFFALVLRQCNVSQLLQLRLYPVVEGRDRV